MPPLTKPSKKRILKNVVVISAGCTILFTSYDGLSMLQSTVNSEHNIGIISQAVIYFCFSVSALVLPKYVIKRLGVKVTLVLSMLTYLPYVASNFYPHWSVMMPTSVLIGLGASLLWGSQAIYLNDLARMYAELLLLVSPENESDQNRSSSGDNEEVSVIYHRSVINRGGGYGSFSNEEDLNGDSGSRNKDNVKTKSGTQTNKDEKCTTLIDGNLGCQSDNQNGGLNSRTSSFGSKGNVENKKSKFPQDIGGSDDRTCDTTINLNAEDSNSDSWNSDLTKYLKPEVESNKKSSIPVSFVNSGFDSGNEIDQTTKQSIPTLLSGKTSIPKCFDSTRFGRNKTDDDTKPIVTKTEILRNRKKTIDSTTARFFGFHGMAFLTCGVWSNLMSYYVMKGGAGQDAGNSTASSCACGAKFCDQHCEDHHSFTQMANETRYLLTGICVGLCFVSILVIVFLLDPLDDNEETTTEDDSSTLRLLMATWDIAKTPDLLMLTPVSLYIGMAQAFFVGDFTKAFVGCAWGTGNVGLAAAAYGGACAVSAFVAGWAVRTLGRTPVFSSAALLNVATCVMLLTWVPTREDEAIFFVAAAMWGLYVGTIFSQIRALFGVLFKADEEAAFATFHTWYSLGFFFSFAFSGLLCTAVKIWALLAVSTLGFTGYLLVERKYKDIKTVEVVVSMTSSADSCRGAVDMNGQAKAVSIVVTPSSPDHLGHDEVIIRQRTWSASRPRKPEVIQ